MQVGGAFSLNPLSAVWSGEPREESVMVGHCGLLERLWLIRIPALSLAQYQEAGVHTFQCRCREGTYPEPHWFCWWSYRTKGGRPHTDSEAGGKVVELMKQTADGNSSDGEADFCKYRHIAAPRGMQSMLTCAQTSSSWKPCGCEPWLSSDCASQLSSFAYRP